VRDHVGDCRSIRLPDLRVADPREQIPELVGVFPRTFAPVQCGNQILDPVDPLGGVLV
tara:strand:- start:1275 stop:1448 length:174 start_codon:yes stop_codon:yes gene_type:complete